MSSKKIQNVAIFYGGYGPEFDISRQSAQFVQSVLSPIGWQLYVVEVSKSGYKVFDAQNTPLKFDPEDFRIIEKSKKQKIDVVFNSIHGPPGEDGQLAELLEKHQIPHTSSDAEFARLTFDKHSCLSHLEEIGINRPSFCYLNKHDSIPLEEIDQTVGFPCFVKPSRSGSSFGISKVDNIDQLEKAVQQAFEVDDGVLVEKALDGTEVSVSVIRWKGQLLVLPMTELVSHNPFFDYEAKYLGKSDEITPARITNQSKKEIESIAKKMYTFLGLKGATRSEFIIQNQQVFLLEVNTVPGFTGVSILPQQVQVAGLDLTEFFGGLVRQSME